MKKNRNLLVRCFSISLFLFSSFQFIYSQEKVTDSTKSPDKAIDGISVKENYNISLSEEKSDKDANTKNNIKANVEDTKKHYFIALGGAILANGGIFLWNKFMIGAEWTKVTANDLDHFWLKKQTWDNDWYWTNFVLHPYQGSLSYMTARASNLNRIESLLLATGASYAWEFLCETNDPSKNDLLYTPIGSFPVGEMLYRLSLEADEISKLFGYAINPMRLYTDFATGHRAPGSVGNINTLSFSVLMGTMQTWSRYDWNGRGHTKSRPFPVFATPEIYVIYGDPYGHETREPFSEFELRAGGGVGYNADEKEAMYDIHIFSNGLLLTWSPHWGELDTTIGLGYDYDFIWHSFMELTSIAPGFVLKQRFIGEDATYEWQAHLGWNILGTSDYYYYFYDINRPRGIYREYSFNTGIEGVLQWKYTTLHGYVIDTSLRYYGLYDFYNQKQSTAQTGWEDIGILELGGEIPVSSKVAIGIRNELYAKRACYHDASRVEQVAYKGMVFAKLKAK